MFQARGHWVLTFLMLVSPSRTCASIPTFLDELFSEVRIEYSSFRESEYSGFCSANGLQPADDTNRPSFFRIYFLHDLLTTSNASNCARGGLLRIPYFWHWVEPNPRHDILALPDSVPLTSIPAQPPYQRYASFADIDRVPALYLGDLVTEAPGYHHPNCGSFFTFGWCSEREMAYTALMTSWGFPSKIWQSGIHTFSVVWCEFTTITGATKVMAAEVDNTFDSISWVEVPGTMPLDRWLEETGSGAQIDWYNNKARSRDQLEALGEIQVGDRAQARFRSRIQEGISVEH